MGITTKKSGSPTGRDGQSGQVEVETAVILPMVVFLLLGLIQLGLLHQARIFAKYGSYRAVRTGSLHNGDVEKMEMAALASVLPIVSRAKGGAEVLGRTDNATNWVKKWMRPGFGMGLKNRMVDFPSLPYTEVTICGPAKGDVSGAVYNDTAAFDMIATSSEGVNTKLRIRLVLYYRMIIPFANWMIHRMWRGEKIVEELHLDARDVVIPNASIDAKVIAAAKQGIFIIPIETHYSMKMHSDIPLANFPETANECH